ncbi:T9SS type B sorting domain-containing protein [Capnocytophaga stomatis]|uniref:T9SS type B sorting domain-containing protein n=1 Tax=Capnocytophaga stomatis TaxID=1848904 RepID=UPI00385A0586
MKKFLFVFTFLITTLVVKGQQCFENFTTTTKSGLCLSDATLTVKVPDGCKGTFAVELIEPNQIGLPSVPLLDANGSYTFTNLKAGTYTVTLINQSNSTRSTSKTVQVTSTYRNIDITAPQITAPSSVGNDARIRFNIRPTGGIGPFRVSIVNPDGSPLNPPIPSQQITKATSDVPVVFQGNATTPIKTGNVVIVVEDLANNVVDCGEIRKEPIQIPMPNPSSQFKIVKNGVVSRIRTDSNCKHQFWIRVEREDKTQFTVENVQYMRQPGVAVIRNLTKGIEYDVSYTFSDGTISEPLSYYSGYDFDIGDTVEVIIRGTVNAIHEKFTLTPQMMDPMFNQPNDPTTNTAVYLWNISNRACNPDEWNMSVGEYWMWRQFPNEIDASNPATYGRYEWYQPMRYAWLTEAERVAGKVGYYYEVYRGATVSGPWTKLTHGTDYKQDNANNIVLLPPITRQGRAAFRVVYKNNSTGAKAPQSCYEPEKVRWMQFIDENYLEKAYDGLEMGTGVFENTVSLRLYLSTTRFVYPAKISIMPSDGSTSKTFRTSLPLDTDTYERTIKFPIEEEIPDPAVITPKISFSVKGDFPEGDYNITLTDACGRTITKTIPLRRPAKYDGDFVRVDQGCQYASVTYDLRANYPKTALAYFTIGVQHKTPSGWRSVPGQPTLRYAGTGTFYNLPPGEYRLYMTNIAYSMLERMVWKSNGYQIPNQRIDYTSDGFTVMEPWDKYLRGTAEWQRGMARFITNYHEFTIKETNPLQTDVSATYCDRTNGNGLVVIGIKNPEDIRYPLTFRLKDATGNVISKTYDKGSGATSHVFSNVSDGDYVVETEHTCGKWYNNVTVKASNYANPRMRYTLGNLDPCLGGEVTLIFGGSEQLFDIEWFRLDADGNEVLPSIGIGKTVVQTISSTTTFRAKYKIKSLEGICPGTKLDGVLENTITIEPDKTAPVITGCPPTPIEVNAAVGACSAIVNWETITATDNCTWTHTQTHQSGDRFDIGTHTVTYVFTDALGNTSTCTFNVIVKSNALNLSVDASYINGTGNVLTQDLALNQQFQYRIEYKNVGQENITTSTLTIKFSDNPYVTIGEPVLTEASVGNYVPTYTKQDRTYTFVLPKETLRGNSEERKIYIPLTVNGDYSEIGKACMNFLSTNYVFEYEGGNQDCLIPKQIKTATNTIVISTENNERSELFCAGSSLELTATEGFDSYKWYLDGVLIPTSTSNKHLATSPGVYTVEKIKNCDGTTLVSKEIIKFREHDASDADLIKAQANGGAICGADGRWTSHFILCNEPSRTIKVNFIDTKLEWQRYNGTSTNSKCPDYGGDWRIDANGVGNTFTANTQGKYRLKVTSSNGCEAYYYFDVYVNTLAGEIVQPVGHITNYQPGNFTVRMVTEGITYQYTLRDAAGQIVNGINKATGSHDYRITGISEPGTYTIEVTSPNLANCSTILTAKIEKQTELTATATPKAWTDCNKLNVLFEVQGGKSPYEFAIWKINGVQKYPDYASIPASEFNIATIPDGQSFIEKEVNITQPGEYIFVTKDANVAYAETPKIDIYPEGVDGYTIDTKDIVCGFAPNSGQISVNFNSRLQNITTELHKLDATGNRVETYTPNATGFYDGLTAGKYELEISIKKSGIKICQYINPVQIYENENTLKAFAGVVEDESCDNVNTPRKYKVHVNNVSGGSGTGYVYSSNGVDYGTSNVLYLSGSGKVYVKDSNGCPLEIDVNIAPLVPPTVSVSNVEYNCSGQGTFTVTATPTGDYEYEVVGNTISERKKTNVFTLPVGNYSVFVHYRPGSSLATTPNYLFREDFGQGDDTCDNSVTYMTCKPNEVLESNQYVITKQVQGRTEWVSPTPTDASAMANGRYLAVNANSNQGNLGIIYRKEIKDVVQGTELKVSLKLHNLLSPTYSGGKNPNVDLVILNAIGGAEIQRIGLGQILATGAWESKSVTFNAASITTSQLIFEIRSKEGTSAQAGSDLAVDDIVIWQDTKLCDVRLESQSVSVEENKAFKITGTPEDAKCGSLGKLNLRIENRNGANLSYSSDNVNWTALAVTLVSASEDTAVINDLPATTGGIVYVRKDTDHSCVAEANYIINAPETISVTTTLLRGVSCDNANAEVKITATGGTKPYQSFRIGTTTQPAVNNEAIFSSVPAGTYEIAVADANGCIVTSTLEVADKLPLTLDVENLEACSLGGDTGRIQVTVTNGNGNYRFSQNGRDFYPSPFADGAYFVFENLPVGNHTFTVIDALNCKQQISAEVYEPLRLNVEGPTEHLTCHQTSKSVYNLKATGGDPTKVKEFLWSNDGITFNSGNAPGITITTTAGSAVFSTTEEGTYYFRVRYEYEAGEYCLATSLKRDVKITKPKFKGDVTSTNITCGGDASGRINISADNIEGGQSPYELLLFDGTATTTHSVGNITGLKAGTYTLTIKDAGGCFSEPTSVTITENPVLNVTVTPKEVHCNAGQGMDLGSVAIQFDNGGTAPFSIEIRYKDVVHANTVHTESNISIGTVVRKTGLIPHDYTYVITDANGCKTKGEFTVAGTSDRLIASVTGITAGCATASITISAYNAGGESIAAGSHWFAVYTLGLMPPTGTPPTTGNVWNVGGTTWYRGTKVKLMNHLGVEVDGVTATLRDLIPGATYKFMVYDNTTKCYIIEEAGKVPPAQSKLKISKPAPKSTTCHDANDGKVNFTLSNWDTSTTVVDYEVYTYSDNRATAFKAPVPVAMPMNIEITGLPANKYYVVFTEKETGCKKASEPFVIKKSLTELIVENPTTSNDNCKGGNGQISVDVREGLAPYKHYYHNTASGATPTGTVLEALLDTSTDTSSKKVAAGQWIVFVRDASGCIKTTSPITVGMDSQPAINSIEVEDPCADNTSFAVRLNLSKVGTGQHSYRVLMGATVVSTWTDISIAQGITSFTLPIRLAAGNTYRIELKDGNGCEANGTVNIPLPMSYNVSSLPMTCGTNEVKIILSDIKGGSGGYEYNLDKIYEVDEQGNEYVVPIATFARVVGGTHTITIGNGEGKYRVRLYDVANKKCYITKEIQVDAPVQSQIEVVSVTNPSCFVGTGSLRVQAKPNTEVPFTFRITATSNPAITVPIAATTSGNDYAVFDNLPSSDTGIVYTIEATSVKNCVATTTATITSPSELAIAPDALKFDKYQCVANTNLPTLPILSFDLGKVSGGTQTYTRIEFYEVGVAAALSTQIVTTGKTIYTYQLPQHLTAQKAYNVKVYDANGCSVVSSNENVAPALILNKVTVTTNKTIDCNTNLQDITVELVTGTPYNNESIVYTVIKRNQNGSEAVHTTKTSNSLREIFSLPVGNYTIVVVNRDTDCEVKTSYDVHSPKTFILTATNSVNVKCHNGSDGEITLTFTDTRLTDGDQAADGFTYVISPIAPSAGSTKNRTVNNGTTETVTGLLAGKYQVEATSIRNGCKAVTSFEITQNERPISATANETFGVTCLNNKGEVMVIVNGGKAPYDVVLTSADGSVNQTKTGGDITNNSGQFLFIGLKSDPVSGSLAYNVSVTDDSGCVQPNITTVTLTHPTPVTATATITQEITCPGANDAVITISDVSGGSDAGTYNYVLQGTNTSITQSSTVFTNLPPDTYTVIVTDAWDCDFTVGTLTVVDATPMSVTRTGAELTVCYAEKTAWINVEIQGGTAPYVAELLRTDAVVSIHTQNVTAADPNFRVPAMLGVGEYEIRITDARGCTLSPTYKFEVKEVPDLTSKATQEGTCESNVYKTWIEVKFRSNMNFDKLSYQLGTGAKRTFSRHSDNIGYIDENVFENLTGTQTLTIFYNDVDVETRLPVECTYALTEPILIEKTIQLGEVQVVPNTAINTIEVKGKDGVQPYTYVFNGQNQGENGVYQLKFTDPEEIINGKRYKVINVVVYDSAGCSSTKVIKEEYFDITIPNFFTPDGDGVNDTWKPKYAENYPYMRIYIYDRYGRKLITLSQGEAWDGTYEKRELPSGDYWYIIDLNSNIDSRKFNGNFTLYR